MKVWVVLYHYYDDCHIEGIFDSYSKAFECSDKPGHHHYIEEWSVQ